MIEAKMREALKLAGVTPDDLKAGRATAARITDRDCECRGSGIRLDIKGPKVTATLCRCFEIQVVKNV